MQTPTIDSSRNKLREEAKNFFVFALIYGSGALLHFQVSAVKSTEIVRHVGFGAALAVVCYLVTTLLRLRAARQREEDVGK
jgi:hypothetical protein